MNKYNIVWILVDSVRRYHSDSDDRGRLAIMDEFAKESIEFLNCVTSAPSTVMSISAMMTSLPAYYIGRNYSDFRFDSKYFLTLNTILKQSGYNCHALLRHKEIREKMRGIFDIAPKRYWPKNFSHRQWWSNKDITRLRDNILKTHDINVPSFWFFDYNCRKDPNISELVKDTIHTMENNGFTSANTIYVLCSDHGYPDPRRGITPELLKQNHMTHDMFMTDDNILVPMILRFPGASPGQRIQATVSTKDIMPTLLEILQIKVSQDLQSRWLGKNLLPLINGDVKDGYLKRIIRTDARFLGQSCRTTALRGDRYKYVYHHDEEKEEFFYVETFNVNEKNIIDSEVPTVRERLAEFRAEFKKSEEDGVNFQNNYAVHKLKEQIDKIRGGKSVSQFKILIISTISGSFLNSIGTAIRNILKEGTIEVLTKKDLIKGLKKANQFDRYIEFHDENLNVSQSELKQINATSFDLVILTYDSGQEKEFKLLLKSAKKIYQKQLVMMDINMVMSVRKGQIQRYIRTLYANRDFILQEPSLLIYECWKVLRTCFFRIKSKTLSKLNKKKHKIQSN